METDDLISVLMPVYNVEKYVGKAVESILMQTYQNFELIIVDDCSTDKTYQILQSIAQRDKRIQLFRNHKNLKICKTLNYALSKCEGNFIARMDGDDICTNDRLEKLKNYLDKHPHISLVGSQAANIDVKGRITGYKYFPQDYKTIKKILPKVNCILHIWLARKDMYDCLEGYRNIPYAEDYDFLLRGVRMGYLMENIPDVSYFVRTRDGNTQSLNGIQQEKAKFYVRKLFWKESACDRNLYLWKDYRNSVKSSKPEKVRYNKAYGYVRKALENRENKFVMQLNVLKAMCVSKYCRNYILEAVYLRFIIKLYKERKNERGTTGFCNHSLL